MQAIVTLVGNINNEAILRKPFPEKGGNLGFILNYQNPHGQTPGSW
jgi:hypothetical protein